MMRRKSRGGAQRGFTLLETIVALTLLGLMLAVLSGSIRFAGKSRDAGVGQRQDFRLGDLFLNVADDPRVRRAGGRSVGVRP